MFVGTIEEAIKYFQEHKDKSKVITFCEWSVDDAIEHLDFKFENGEITELSEERKQEIAEGAIHDMHNSHDCDYGMTWNKLYYAIDQNLKKEEVTSE